jgi:hypothetical protein
MDYILIGDKISNFKELKSQGFDSWWNSQRLSRILIRDSPAGICPERINRRDDFMIWRIDLKCGLT